MTSTTSSSSIAAATGGCRTRCTLSSDACRRRVRAPAQASPARSSAPESAPDRVAPKRPETPRNGSRRRAAGSSTVRRSFHTVEAEGSIPSTPTTLFSVGESARKRIAAESPSGGRPHLRPPLDASDPRVESPSTASHLARRSRARRPPNTRASDPPPAIGMCLGWPFLALPCAQEGRPVFRGRTAPPWAPGKIGMATTGPRRLWSRTETIRRAQRKPSYVNSVPRG